MLSRGRTVGTVAILLVPIFSKYFYMASLTSYYTFYLLHRFGLSVQEAQVHLFVFLGSVAAGDRFGRKLVIWGSIVGLLPCTLALPHATLLGTVLLTVPIGLILASAMPAILVHAQELLPGRVGLVGCSSASPSGWAASARRCSANSRTAPASSRSTRSARSCRPSVSWRSSCRGSRRRGPAERSRDPRRRGGAVYSAASARPRVCTASKPSNWGCER